MKALKTAIAGATALAIASAGLLLAAGAAQAVGTVVPAITGDPNAANGTISFYDAPATRSPAARCLTVRRLRGCLVGDRQDRHPKATLFVATPDHTKSNSLQWFNQQLTAASTWPLVGAPAGVAAPRAPACRRSPSPPVTATWPVRSPVR